MSLTCETASLFSPPIMEKIRSSGFDSRDEPWFSSFESIFESMPGSFDAQT